LHLDEGLLVLHNGLPRLDGLSTLVGLGGEGAVIMGGKVPDTLGPIAGLAQLLPPLVVARLASVNHAVPQSEVVTEAAVVRKTHV
jgi:hypothetical protein